MEGWDKSTPVNLWMTHECFQEDTFGTHLVDGSANLEAWRTDRTSSQSAFPAVTADTEWEELLITDEVFPSFFDDVVHESEIQAPQTHYFNNSNESSNNIPPSIITPLIPIRKSFHKCKTSRTTLGQQDGKKLDENGLAEEVATVIERGIQEDILSQTPTLYSLLRAWVVGNTSQRYYIRPKRKTLVDYLSTRSKPIDSHQPTKFHPKHTAKNGQTNSHSNRAYHPPPIDILGWLKIRHILKESSPYSKYDASQMHKTRVRKARIQRVLRRKEVEHAQQNLANKGIKVK
ncbi:hypothetical protein IV203_029539 [Nitzschia inconspicua]|uniref:Uncharacterized protein n=1 Tax=Nitzschia inconspicua TaxID=303405 RepID=A0A9K3Q3C9_9STRA|nr:hypothetical protein IV203_029539 [Nitzschia inconspicua]